MLYWLPAIAIVAVAPLAISNGWRVALSYGLGVLHLGGDGWNLLGLITLIGALALWCLPEMFLGRYRKGRTDHGDAP